MTGWAWVDYNATPGNWTDAADWFPASVPASTGDVSDDSGTVDVTTDVGTVNSLSLNYNATLNDNGGLSVIDGGELNITATLVANGTSAPIEVSSSSMGGGSSLTVGVTMSVTNKGSGSGVGPVDIDTSDGAGGSVFKVGGALTLDSQINVDNASGEGGSTVTVGGAMKLGGDDYQGILRIGPSDGSLSSATTVTVGALAGTGDLIQINGGSASLATFDIHAAADLGAVGIAEDYVSLSGDSLLEFSSGQINQIDEYDGISLNGANAFISDSGNTTANGALDGPLTIQEGPTDAFLGSGGSLGLNDGASVTTAAVSNAGGGYNQGGGVYLDDDANGWNYVGSSLTAGGIFANSGTVQVGGSLYSFVNTTLTANGFTNFIGSRYGYLYVDGADEFGGKAIVDITGVAGMGAVGQIEGHVYLAANSGAAMLEFASGQITGIAANATLTMYGDNALVADAGNLTSNSALTSLATIAGALTFSDNLTTTVAMNVTGSVFIYGYGGPPQSITIGGALTNSGSVTIGSDYGGETQSVIAATGLANTGTITLGGLGTLNIGGAASNSGVIDIGATSEAAFTGALTGPGTVNLISRGVLQLGVAANTGTIAFGTGGGMVELAAGTSLGATVSGWGDEDGVDFQTVAFAASDKVVVAAPTIDIETSTGAIVASFAVTGTPAASQFGLSNDGTGHLLVSEGLPTLSTPASATLGVGKAAAIAGVSVQEGGLAAGETFTVTVTDGAGLLSATGSTVTGAGTTDLHITGSEAQVNAALATLTDTDSTAGLDTIRLGATDSLDNVAAAQSISVTIDGLPQLAEPATAIAAAGKASSIDGASLSQNGAATENFTVILTDASGLLAATGPGVSGAGSKSLTIAGSLTQVNADLATLTDDQSAVGTDTITLNATDGYGNVATTGSISVTALAQIHWKSQASANFSTAGDWTGGAAPGAVDDAILDAAGSKAYTVTASTSQSVDSIQTASTATLAITGGTFAVTNGTGVGANGGVITVANTATLTLAGVFDNTGAIDLAGGALTVAGTFNNTGGILSAASGSNADILNATLIGGMLKTSAGGVVTLSNDNAEGSIAIADGAAVTATGDLQDTGTVAIDSTGDLTSLTVTGGYLYLYGGGDLTLSDNAHNEIVGASPTAELYVSGAEISGAGQLGGGEMELYNEASGVIDGSGVANALIINTGSASIINQGLIEATGKGGMTIAGAVDNTGSLAAMGGDISISGAVTGTGAVSAAAGDEVVFSGTGGSFSGTFTGAGTVGFTGGTDAFDGVSLGAATALTGAATVTLAGVVTAAKALTVGGSARLVIGSSGAYLTGPGGVSLANNVIKGVVSGAVLTNDTLISGGGQVGDDQMILDNVVGGTIESLGAKALTLNTGGNTISNAGVINADGAALIIASALHNAGTLDAVSSALTVNGAVTGVGLYEIVAGSLDFTSTFNQNVTFRAGSTGALQLAHSQAYTSTITGFSTTGATALDLADISYVSGATTASFSGTASSGVLTVTDGTHTARINLTGDYLGATWDLSAATAGGTKIVDPVAAPPAASARPPGAAAQAHGFAQAASALTPRGAAAVGPAAESWRSASVMLATPTA